MRNLISRINRAKQRVVGRIRLGLWPKAPSSTTGALNYTPTMTQTLHVGNRMHSISFDCTDSDTKTPAQIEALRSRIYRATDRWLNLCQASLSVAK